MIGHSFAIEIFTQRENGRLYVKLRNLMIPMNEEKKSDYIFSPHFFQLHNCITVRHLPTLRAKCARIFPDCGRGSIS